ncbi:alpha/beta fold hydrolase [Aestuariispira insulae]|uniref:3-methylmercaptopropionyl-CoA ligase n=1 Tax=Aestuariispira insulae TaxID=1461337 RepID=A0A3D9HMQ7_9PROT|nr:alpha/beta fold hydrolase [Aestuariispira insulae]RED50749.1 acyl-CoA synthetase (AMP-forming)/AMP-acid ligase II [Aestuariispira insulae]
MTSGSMGHHQINETTYQRCVGAFSFLHDRLGINIKVHDPENYLDSGQIFLFNHFARFETIIPQYLIHKQTGAYCRSIATHELFAGSETFSKFLWNVGAVPNNHPGLLPFLAAEILRGRKIIVFPEGGMIKDRRVVDQDGKYSIFSPSDKTHRKHHKGAAAIAITLEMFKRRILSVHKAGEEDRLYRWVNALGFGDLEMMIAAAQKPTQVVPSNITFYPIRSDDNILRKGMELFGGELGSQAREELLIEGNILLKETDMDIRIGKPRVPELSWNPLENILLKQMFERTESLEQLFSLQTGSDRLVDRMIGTALARKTTRLRDKCMHSMYALVSINLSHLASLLILNLLDRNIEEIEHDRFHRLLYSVIKNAQAQPDIHHHRSISNPEAYDGIHQGSCRGFSQFIGRAVSSGLIEATANRYRFLPKLRQEHTFHETRLENPIIVYANEARPVKSACLAVEQAMENEYPAEHPTFAHNLFDDEVKAFHWCRETYSRSRHEEINKQETATKSGAPFLLMPEGRARKQQARLGIVLVHGFLASPAEMRSFGEKLWAMGYPVLGARLRGHGTSPWDLKDRSWQEWLGSVRRGYEIMSMLADEVCLIGFSTGGALCLRLAAEKPKRLAAVVSVSAPVKFRNKNLVFVPLINSLNKLTEMVTPAEGIMTFRVNESEHPDINYRNIPLAGLQELRLLVNDMRDHLDIVTCPALILQGKDDPVIDPVSATILHEKIASANKKLNILPANRHGILNEDLGGCQDIIADYVDKLSLELSVALGHVAEQKNLSQPHKVGTPVFSLDAVFQHPLKVLKTGLKRFQMLRSPGEPPEIQTETEKYPWEKSYPDGTNWDSTIPIAPLTDLLDEAVTKYSDKPCTHFRGKRLRYREIGKLVDKAARGFQQLGVTKGSVVAMMLPNCPYAVICFYGILKAGGTVVQINPLYSRHEISHQVRDSGARLMVTLDMKGMYEKIAPEKGKDTLPMGLRKLIVCRVSGLLKLTDKILFDLMKSKEVAKIPEDDRHVPFAALVNNDGLIDPPILDPINDIAVLQYTGGTTGRPKGAKLSHANLYANVIQLTQLARNAEKGHEKVLGILPLFHAFGMTAVMNLGIYLGAELILLPNFQLSKVMETLTKLKPTIFIGVPTMYSAINGAMNPEQHDLSSLTLCISGGAPLPRAVQDHFEILADCPIFEGYGLSETSPVCTVNPLTGGGKPGSVGLPLPRTIISIRSIDGNGVQMPAGEIGEICVSGPQVMSGYTSNSDEGSDVFYDTALRTGDLGYLDEDGYLFIVDRIKEMILSGGFNVYPRMVEEEIYQHPAVAEAAVIGLPDEHRGETVMAFIQLKAGKELTAGALRQYLKERLAPYKIPRRIEFRDELPKTPIGKISKRDLIAELTEPAGPAPTVASAGD